MKLYEYLYFNSFKGIFLDMELMMFVSCGLDLEFPFEFIQNLRIMDEVKL